MLPLPLLATLMPHTMAESSKSKKNKKKSVANTKKKRPSQDDGLEMKSNIGSALQKLWQARPSRTTLNQLGVAFALVVLVLSVRHLQNEVKRPRREFGAPAKIHGSKTQVNSTSRGGKGSLAPLAQQIRQALDSGAPGGKFGQVRSAAQTRLRFQDEDRESAQLSLENRRQLQHALDEAQGEARDGRMRCWWGEHCYRKNPDHLRNYAHPVRYISKSKVSTTRARQSAQTTMFGHASAFQGDKDWFAINGTKRKKLQLEVTLAGPSPVALKAANRHFADADGYRGKEWPSYTREPTN